MTGMLANVLTNPVLSNIAQSTTKSVSLETGMKAAGRPAFIIADKNIDKSTKNYAAVKEFLYQTACLAIYMAIVIPVFKNGAYAIAKKSFKDEKAFSYFKNAKSYLEYLRLAKMEKTERISLMQQKNFNPKLSEQIKNNLIMQDNPEKYSIIKGAIELGNIVGSVVGLAIVAPQVIHKVVHPVLKLLDSKNSSSKKIISHTESAASANSEKDNKLNVKI